MTNPAFFSSQSASADTAYGKGRPNTLITAFGLSKTMHQWAIDAGVPYGTLNNRIWRGWPPEVAVSTKVGGRPGGFGAIAAERRQAIASLGGKAAHAMGAAHQFTSDEARIAGGKGLAKRKPRPPRPPQSELEASNPHTDRRAKCLYKLQRQCARKRGIEWLFTFESWASMWHESGKWRQRGRGAERFCTARKGDVGPYSSENVEILTNRQNSIDCQRVLRLRREAARLLSGSAL